MDAALADEALVGLDDRLAEVQARAAEGVAEELDLGGLKRFLLFFRALEGEKTQRRRTKQKKPLPLSPFTCFVRCRLISTPSKNGASVGSSRMRE